MKFPFWNLLYFSMRNLERKPRRTMLLIIGLAFANLMAIWIPTFRYNTNRVMMENILGMKFGQEQIMKPGHINFENMRISPYAHFDKNQLENLLPKNAPYTWRVQSIVMLASDFGTTPVNLMGYDLDKELNFTLLKKILPDSFKFKNPYPILLGKKLARKLQVRIGDKVSAIGQATDGSLANENFIVENILDLGGGVFESTFAVTGLEDMQNFLSLPSNRVHLLVNFDQTSYSKIAKNSGLERRSWKKFLPTIASGARFMNRFTQFYSIFFIIVASIAAGAAMALSFLERINEYKMLNILGTPTQWIRISMMMEIILVCFSSIIIGNILAVAVFTLFQIFPLDLTIITGGTPVQMGGMALSGKITMLIEHSIFYQSNFFFIFILFVSSLYPVTLVIKKTHKPA